MNNDRVVVNKIWKNSQEKKLEVGSKSIRPTSITARQTGDTIMKH